LAYDLGKHGVILRVFVAGGTGSPMVMRQKKEEEVKNKNEKRRTRRRRRSKRLG